MSSVFIPCGLAFIMLTVGLGLRVRDFRAVALRPRLAVAGLLLQVVGLPMLAAAVATTFGLPPTSALGLVLIACVPGGVTSNFITVLARGDAALSVVLTTAATTLAIVSVPFVLAAAFAWFGASGPGAAAALPIGATARAVLVVTVVPLAVGMIVRAFRPAWAGRRLEPARKVATVVFAAVVVLAFASDWNVVEAHWRTVGPAVLTFNTLAVLAGLVAGRALRAGVRSTLTLGIESGLQNVALALFLGGTVLGEPALMVPAVIYALVMNASALVLVALGRRFAAAESGVVLAGRR